MRKSLQLLRSMSGGEIFLNTLATELRTNTISRNSSRNKCLDQRNKKQGEECSLMTLDCVLDCKPAI